MQKPWSELNIVQCSVQKFTAFSLACTGRTTAMAILEDSDVGSWELARRTAELTLQESDAEVSSAPPASI